MRSPLHLIRPTPTKNLHLLHNTPRPSIAIPIFLTARIATLGIALASIDTRIGSIPIIIIVVVVGVKPMHVEGRMEDALFLFWF